MRLTRVSERVAVDFTSDSLLLEVAAGLDFSPLLLRRHQTRPFGPDLSLCLFLLSFFGLSPSLLPLCFSQGLLSVLRSTRHSLFKSDQQLHSSFDRRGTGPRAWSTVGALTETLCAPYHSCALILHARSINTRPFDCPIPSLLRKDAGRYISFSRSVSSWSPVRTT